MISAVKDDGWVWFRKDDLAESDPSFLDQVRVALVYRPMVEVRSAEDEERAKPILGYREEGDLVGIPRGWASENMTVSRPAVDPPLRRCAWAFPVTLYPDQVEAMDAVMGHFAKGGRECLIHAGTSWGKTVWGLALAHRIQAPVMIACHDKDLLRRYEDEAYRFGASCRFGWAVQDRCEFVNCDIILSTVESLVSRRYPDAFYRYVHMAILDEAHRGGAARTWSEAIPKFSGPYRVGMTGTLTRPDRAEIILNWHFGPVVYKSVAGQSAFQVRREFTGWKPMNDLTFRRINDAKQIEILSGSEARNRAIVRVLVRAVAKGRHPIVMVHRRDHCEKIVKLFREEAEADGVDATVGVYLGGMSADELDAAGRATVTIGTYEKLATGVNLPRKDTLFLATPIGGGNQLKQAYGRIVSTGDRRNHPDKKPPMVVDFIDEKTEFGLRMWASRKGTYQLRGVAFAKSEIEESAFRRIGEERRARGVKGISRNVEIPVKIHKN